MFLIFPSSYRLRISAPIESASKLLDPITSGGVSVAVVSAPLDGGAWISTAMGFHDCTNFATAQYERTNAKRVYSPRPSATRRGMEAPGFSRGRIPPPHRKAGIHLTRNPRILAGGRFRIDFNSGASDFTINRRIFVNMRYVENIHFFAVKRIFDVSDQTDKTQPL